MRIARKAVGYRTRAHDSGMSFALFRRSGYLHPGWGFGMTDRQFYLLLALLLLALAAGEVVYAMVGPLSETTGQLGELSAASIACAKSLQLEKAACASLPGRLPEPAKGK